MVRKDHTVNQGLWQPSGYSKGRGGYLDGGNDGWKARRQQPSPSHLKESGARPHHFIYSTALFRLHTNPAEYTDMPSKGKKSVYSKMLSNS